MALTPAITDIEELKNHPALACLLGWNSAVVQSVMFDREELTIWVTHLPVLLLPKVRQLSKFTFADYVTI